jgi:hypothetical protein
MTEEAKIKDLRYIRTTVDGKSMRCAMCGGTEPMPDTGTAERDLDIKRAFVQSHEKCGNMKLGKFKRGARVRVSPEAYGQENVGQMGTSHGPEKRKLEPKYGREISVWLDSGERCFMYPANLEVVEEAK